VRIAVVAPLHESVPPRYYGGTERVVSYLTEELVALGHDVTLFATADSRTSARLRPMAPSGLRLDSTCRDPLAWHVAMVHDVMEAAREFDLVHFHIDHVHFPALRARPVPAVTTVHGRLDLPELGPLYQRFGDMALVSISDAQRAPLPRAGWLATVHHGLPTELLPFNPRGGGYAAFLGRMSPEKRPDRAIRIAQRAGVPLRIAAKIEKSDAAYFEAEVHPLLSAPGVEFMGEIGEREKAAFLGDAAALLFPIDWPEPFGLAMIEAMSCGTPVIAYRCGSVPEIVDDGVSGWTVSSEDEAVERLASIGTLSRLACRRTFERRFSASRMARDYETVYREVLAGSRGLPEIRPAA
jgi:glycosyltransferase involved in cell wall biosynthesis